MAAGAEVTVGDDRITANRIIIANHVMVATDTVAIHISIVVTTTGGINHLGDCA